MYCMYMFPQIDQTSIRVCFFFLLHAARSLFMHVFGKNRFSDLRIKHHCSPHPKQTTSGAAAIEPIRKIDS